MSLVSLPPIPLVDPVDATSSDVLDFETAALIARLALEDLDELLGQQRGRVNEAELQRQREHYQQLLADVEEARRSMSPHMRARKCASHRSLANCGTRHIEDLSVAERPPQREALSSPLPAAMFCRKALCVQNYQCTSSFAIAADLSNETNSNLQRRTLHILILCRQWVE
ncbi:hypothetical protein CPB84DRAFT_1854286 [Gymnopilus junonius]|uniref:Uncharacterized protein n=1 Tax=Gymnopilus junonius TaxID=109634 RepID=A0A9P5TGB1_GYMJU|nr:hypothetical protein CPB84DRAFT_1854286 [Gymnopilus junonius]